MFWDTTAFIDLFREFPVAVEHYDHVHNGSEAAYCSVITEAELWAGIRDSREELEIVTTLSKFFVIPVNSSIARLAGSLLRSVGAPRAHFGDAVIGATAIRQGETILTADSASQRVFGNSVSYLVYR